MKLKIQVAETQTNINCKKINCKKILHMKGNISED